MTPFNLSVKEKKKIEEKKLYGELKVTFIL